MMKIKNNIEKYPLTLKNKINSIIKTIELIYPEKKVFLFDFLCHFQYTELCNIASDLGVSYEQILNDYGYELISNDRVSSIRSTIIYHPGEEPDFLNPRFSNTLKTLSRYYPSKKINDVIDKEHPRLFEAVWGFALWLGYKNPTEFLNAYGFSCAVLINKNFSREDAIILLDKLKIKYQHEDNKPNNISQLLRSNPDIIEQIKIMKIKSEEWFGISLSDYLLGIGVLLDQSKKQTAMTQTVKYKKASKTTVVSINDFYESTGYLENYFEYKWNKNREPDYDSSYYKITKNLLINIRYGCTMKNYGTTPVAKLDEIIIAYRDGVTEYSLLSDKLVNLKKEYAKSKPSKETEKQIEWMEYLNNNIHSVFPKFSKPFELNLSEMSCQQFISIYENNISQREIAKKYVVLDLETNGLRTTNDDLLSITIFDPATGRIYNRYLPLELQPTVLTTYINGIDDDDVADLSPLTQQEFDKLVEIFDLSKKTILYYSGSKFDYNFLDKYCQRHKIEGIDRLKFENIKKLISDGVYSNGYLTKDNLCKALNICGVSTLHSGINDCYLEWQLFEKFVCEKLIIKSGGIYKYHEDYVVPVTDLFHYPRLVELANINLPELTCEAEFVYEYHVPRNIINKIKKFPTNINGISIENIINTMVGAKECDNREFLVNNRRKLSLVGRLSSMLFEIPISIDEDGKFSTPLTLFAEYIDEINEVNSIIRGAISSVVAYVKEEVFKGKDIRTQEITFSQNNKVMALCDLSSDDAILEIKTYDIFDLKHKNNTIKQMYFQKGGKELFAMSIVFDEKMSLKGEKKLQDLAFKIYKVEINEIVN